MKLLCKTLLAFPATATVATAVAGIGANITVRSAELTLAGTVHLKGLHGDVEVLWDGWGVPHIYANHSADLFCAQGHAVVQDRLWRMELRRRAGRS